MRKYDQVSANTRVSVDPELRQLDRTRHIPIGKGVIAIN